MAFVFLQVERALGPEGTVERELARHVWFDRRPAETFGHPARAALSRASIYRMRLSIIKRLAVAIATRSPDTISQAAALEARKRLRLERSPRTRASAV
jgi:hypothetical protein